MKKIILLALLITVFYHKVNAQYTKLLDFNNTNGWTPFGSLFSDGTFLYGMTASGGTNYMGVLFKIKPDGTGYSKLLDFNSANGSYPYGSLISDGTFLYGMTELGGTNDDGVIFKIKPDGTGYSKLLDFDNINGKAPHGSLITDGTFLYGIAQAGGINNYGTIIKIKPDGTGYAKLHDFDNINGSFALGSLISDGVFLYGMTGQGGIDSAGTVFKIKPDGTGYTKILDFTGTNGRMPKYSSLISDGTFLYGMTYAGGIGSCIGGPGGCGVIFKIKPDGTGYSKLFDFAGTNGNYPFGSLVYDGTFLFGMTSSGSNGINVGGNIFKIKPDGTGYSDLFDFAGGANGWGPSGSLISVGNFLYGMTVYGGTSTNCTSNGCGVIFKIKNCIANYTTSYDSIQNIFTLNVDSATTALTTSYHWDFGDGASSNLTTPSHTYTADTIYNVCMKIYLAGGDSCTYCHTIGKDYLGNIYRNPGFTVNVHHGNSPSSISQNFPIETDIAIFPNPTNGAFTIITKENEYILTVTNVLGELIYQDEIKSQKAEIDISKHSNGIYFLNIKTEQGTEVQKLIINK